MGGRLEGKFAIVTGAGSSGPGWGNGRSTAVYFAREGATVLAADLREDALAETLEKAQELGVADRLHTYAVDATDPDRVQAMVDFAKEKFGRIDILVNIVGGSSPGATAATSDDVWTKTINYNLNTVFHGCKAVIPIMQEQGAGAIVNLGSASGIRYTGADQSAYAASKAAVIQFTKVTAVQYAKDGVRCNVVIPGQMHTPMVAARLAGERAGGDIDGILAQRQARIPMGWMGDGRDIANAVLYLASDESRFVTGAEIIVDGGMSVRCD
jgi:NAD(P)-dependent dehydrogenase (short-subunit alcohol dehydrogenase family)